MFDYLFESAEQNADNEIDDITLKAHLSKAGFDSNRIDKALSWLENIATLQDKPAGAFFATNGGMRIYSDFEKQKLNTKARGFLLFMENINQLSSSQREMVIEQVMSLDNTQISLSDLKWVIMMVLGNSDDNISEQWLESIVFPEDTGTQH